MDPTTTVALRVKGTELFIFVGGWLYMKIMEEKGLDYYGLQIIEADQVPEFTEPPTALLVKKLKCAEPAWLQDHKKQRQMYGTKKRRRMATQPNRRKEQ